MKRYLIIILLIVIVSFLLPELGLAENTENNNIALETIKKFKNVYEDWIPKVIEHAKNLFYYLCLFDIVWMGVQLILQDGNLYSFALELVKKILFIGFFFALLINSDKWILMIINSFRRIGAEVSIQSNEIKIYPEKVYEAIVRMVNKYLHEFNMWSGDDWIYLGFCIGYLIIAALIGAVVVAAFVEMYFALTVGIILLGFGGSGWTSEYALNYIKYVISLGLKLMAIQIIMALLTKAILDLLAVSDDFKMDDMLTLFILMFFIYALLKKIPEIISGILQGASMGGSSLNVATGAMATAAATTAKATSMAASQMLAATKAAVTGGLAVREAGKLSKEMGVSKTSAIANATKSVMMDNMGSPKAHRRPLAGGVYSELKAQRMANTMPGGGGSQGGSPSQQGKPGSSQQNKPDNEKNAQSQDSKHTQADKILGSDKGSNCYKSGK